MFRSVGRRLAILNTLVVIVVIAMVGLASYLYLARKIETQTDAELRSRSASAVQLWTNVFLEADAGGPSAVVSPTPQSDPSSDDDEHASSSDHENDDIEEHQADELIRSGDTIAYGIDLNGDVIRSLRPIEIDGLPNDDAIDRALKGSIVVETMTLEHQQVRVRTEPVLSEGRIIGAIQVGTGLGPNERVLDFVKFATIGGLLLGTLLALPAGILLANRSMRPIRESFARQRSFVADAAHELRTPLTLIRAEAEYLAQTPDLSSDDQAESESAIVREVDSMASLVSSLLQLARIDEHGHELVGERSDLTEVARNVGRRFEGFALERHVQLDFERLDPAFARCDRAATEQVLAILLDNAIRYTLPEGKVQIRTGTRSEKATIAVTDTGIGVSEKDQRKIFERFFRADPARTRSTGGAGLGLSIAMELMSAQGGRIEVESELGRGSTFTLIFEAAHQAN